MSNENSLGLTNTDSIHNVLAISPSNVLTISPTTVDLELKNEDDDEGISLPTGVPFSLCSQGYLVSPSLSNPTLHSLLATPTVLLQGTTHHGLPEGIEIITVASPTSLLSSQRDSNIKFWHVINPEDNTIIAVGNEDLKQMGLTTADNQGDGDNVPSSMTVDYEDAQVSADLASILMPPPQQPLPPGCPGWASRLKGCEKIGHYYRGYVETEIELDILLTYHKQATQSFWGTRQSPSPAKPSTRFMWKSQYVPYDGIPFVNTGSRAIVMECQYGPRRKGSITKKQSDNNNCSEYRQTCPARIYIKKVRKFPTFKIDISLDKKNMKNAMDKAFHELKQQNLDLIGQDRFYVQLPLASAHEFHDDLPGRGSSGLYAAPVPEPQHVAPVPPPVEVPDVDNLKKTQSLHPLIVKKIRELVAGGEMKVYNIRRSLRIYVMRDLYCGQADANLSRHDFNLFPTVTDLKNHIHQAVKDIENGTLPLTAPRVNVEPMSDSNEDDMINITEMNIWPQHTGLPVTGPVPETVTVTLTQSSGEDGGHVISRIETHMSDGTTHVSTSLTPETAQLLARLNPAMFPPGSLIQLKSDMDTQPIQSPSNNGILNDDLKVEVVGAYSSLDIEDPRQDQVLSMSSDVDIGTMPILLEANSHLIAPPTIKMENHGLNSATHLINVTIMPTGQEQLDELQTDSFDDSL